VTEQYRTPAEIEVKLRRMKFGMEGDVPKYWAAGSKFLTHFFNSMSVIFPEGEKFFIDAVRAFEDRITDPVLREQVRGFVAQEGHHTFQHRLMNAVVAGHGVDTAKHDRWMRDFLKRVWGDMTPERRLAVTCALEHYTAILGHQLLAEPECMDGFDPRMTPLWRWHAVEEAEHKAVCFDVFEHAVSSYLLRVQQQIGASLLFVPILHLIQVRLMREDPTETTWKDVWFGLNWVWGKPGYFRRALVRYASYYKPSFHPWQHDNRELIAKWKQIDEPLYRAA
jgi:uncharacterized protein